MESGTEGLFYQGRTSKIEVSLEVEDIYKRIEVLPSQERAQLIHKMIAMLTVAELADALDEIATKLRNTNS